MKNYKFIVEYDGTKYKGWQKQGNTLQTIQGKIEEILKKMTHMPVEIHGSGRTDAGVHAKAQVGNFKCSTDKNDSEIFAYVNQYLPHDIRLLSLQECDMHFHSRLNAKSKVYSYTFWIGKPSVFHRNYVHSIPAMPDISKMKEACALLQGTHDFLGFSSLKKAKKSTIRTIFSIDIKQQDPQCLVLSFHGDGFLYNSVRILAGTLYEVGIGSKHLSDIQAVFTTKDRKFAGITLPPNGLTLESVFYS